MGSGAEASKAAPSTRRFIYYGHADPISCRSGRRSAPVSRSPTSAVAMSAISSAPHLELGIEPAGATNPMDMPNYHETSPNPSLT